jgi:hypothetical protein
MTGGAHLSAKHGEGQRWLGWRRLPVREEACGQGATSAWPTGPTGRLSGRGPVGKGLGGEVAGWGKKMEVGRGRAKNRSRAQYK